jgi:hypothetical protein
MAAMAAFLPDQIAVVIPCEDKGSKNTVHTILIKSDFKKIFPSFGTILFKQMYA